MTSNCAVPVGTVTGRAMKNNSIAVALAVMLLVVRPGYSQTIAERLGPHFLFGWTTAEQETVAKALHKLEGQTGIDDMLMERQARVLRKLDKGGEVYPLFWPPLAPFTLRSPTGEAWRIYQFSLPEEILTGFAVSRDQYCRAEDQDTDDMDAARAYCADANARAIALFEHSFNGSKAIYPGGKTR